VPVRLAHALQLDLDDLVTSDLDVQARTD
jgi:hypothetical protein